MNSQEMTYLCKPLQSGNRDEGVVVRLVVNHHPLPRFNSHSDSGGGNPWVLQEEVFGQQQGEGFWALNPVFVGQQVDCVGLTAGGYDAAVVALVRRGSYGVCWIILGRCAGCSI